MSAIGASIEILTLRETHEWLGQAESPASALALPIESRGERAAVAFWPLAIAIPGAIALAVRAFSGRRGALLAGLGAAVGFGLVRWQLQRWFTETPDYRVEGHVGRLEIRRYAPQIVVETTVTHRTFDEALEEGYRRLARYIGEEGIAMTSPVTTTVDDGGITVGFILPNALILAPEPGDPRVAVRELAPRRVAALRFHGPHDGETAHVKEKELLGRVRKARLEPKGEPWMSVYDPPWTLRPARRLETSVEIG